MRRAYAKAPTTQRAPCTCCDQTPQQPMATTAIGIHKGALAAACGVPRGAGSCACAIWVLSSHCGMRLHKGGGVITNQHGPVLPSGCHPGGRALNATELRMSPQLACRTAASPWASYVSFFNALHVGSLCSTSVHVPSMVPMPVADISSALHINPRHHGRLQVAKFCKLILSLLRHVLATVQIV